MINVLFIENVVFRRFAGRTPNTKSDENTKILLSAATTAHQQPPRPKVCITPSPAAKFRRASAKPPHEANSLFKGGGSSSSKSRKPSKHSPCGCASPVFFRVRFALPLLLLNSGVCNLEAR